MTPLLCIQDRPPLKRVLVFALGCLLFTGASAQTGGSLEQLFNEGATAYAKGDYAGTISRFSEIIAKAKPGPALEPVYYTIANAKLRQGDNDGAIAAFRLYLQYYPNGAQLNDARAGLTRALINARQVPEALAAIESLRGLRSLTGTQGIDNYPNLLGLTLELSDLLLAENRAVEALALLQTAPWRDQILERQRARVNELANLVRQATAISGSAGLGSATAANRDSLAARLKDATAALESIETNSSFDLPRLLRQAQCHLELDQPWEAIVVYNEILVRFPDAPDLSYALRGLIYARQAAARPADVLRLCQDFLTRFAESPFVAEVAFVGGQNALKLDDNERAEFFFGTAVEHAKDDLLAAAIIQLGITRFDAGKWPGAREMFDRYAKDFPKGEFVEAAAYRSAVSWFLDITDADRYAKAEKAIKAYVKAYPSGTYIADASYRLAVCQFAFQEYEETIKACEAWEKRFPGDALLAQVISLKADVQKTLNRNAAAIDTYLRAASAALSDEVLGYALDEAARLIEQQKDWTRLVDVFSAQIQRQPESSLAMGWYYWVARAQARAGRLDEAWNFLADSVGRQIDNADNGDVEKILELMAQIRARKRNIPASESAEELLTRLKLDETQKTAPLVAARLGYYESSLLGFTRKRDEADQIMLRIGRELPPEKMSAPLLASTGEALAQAGDTERAGAFFKAMLGRFPNSDYRDHAYVGLGDIALDRDKPADALALYNDALEKAGGLHRQREATVGQARAHLALGHLDEAAKLFEVVAGAKAWRGEPTALSLYYLGEIAVRQGDLPKGIAFFQRVFVSQVRHTEWVAKSYLASGRAFEALGKNDEAAATYREMLRNESLQTRAEIATARERLQAIAPSAP